MADLSLPTTQQIDQFNHLAATLLFSILIGMILFGLLVCGIGWLIMRMRTDD